MNYFAEAEDALRRALELSPGEARVTFSLATIIQSRGRPAEAIQIFDAALALGADNAETRYQRSFGYFSQGYFSGAAIDDYDMRWQAETFPSNWREFPQSLWQGEDLAGKKILLWAEQGIGDHIIFSSVVPALVGEGASVMVECDPRLKPLFARSFKGAEIVACEEMPALATQSPDIDFQIPLASMCLRRRAAQEDGFPMGRYLEPDTDLKEKIKARMDAEAGGRPLIGIAWRSARAKIGPLKSMPLDMWGPILTGREALFVNLQYGETNEEVAEAINTTGADIYTDPDIDRFDDLEGFAALVDCLDLVVTTSNVTAHFAGGLGKPCVQALQKSPIWYWGLEATPIAFYASVDRIWQEEENKWGDVIAKISALLDENLS